MKRKSILSLLALGVVSGTFAMGSPLDLQQSSTLNQTGRSHIIKQLRQEYKGEIKQWREKAKQFWTQHKQERQKLKQEVRTFHTQVKAKLFNTEEIEQLKQQILSLKEELKKATDPERIKEIKLQIEKLRKKLHNVVQQAKQNLSEDVKNYLEQLKQLRERFKTATKEEREKIKQEIQELKKKMFEKYPELYQKYQEISQKREQLKQQVEQFKQEKEQQFKYITENLKEKIDNILQKRLFDRISKLSEEKQKKVLERILSRVNKVLDKLNAAIQIHPNNKRLVIKKEIVEYLKQKIEEKLNQLNSIVDEEDVINNTLNEVLGNE